MRMLASVALAALAVGCTASQDTAEGPGAASFPALAGGNRRKNAGFPLVEAAEPLASAAAPVVR